MTLLEQLDKTIQLLEQQIPASPARNANIENALKREMADYFRALDQAIDWNALEQIYYKLARE